MGKFASKMCCVDGRPRRNNNSERDREPTRPPERQLRFSIDSEDSEELEAHHPQVLSSSQTQKVENLQQVQSASTSQDNAPDAQTYVRAFTRTFLKDKKVNKTLGAKKKLESIIDNEGAGSMGTETTKSEYNREISHGTDSPVRDAIKKYRRIKDGIQGDEVTLKQLHTWNTQLDQSQQILKNAGSDILETENFSHTEMKDIEEISKQIENRRKEIARSIYKERYIDRVIPLENTHYQILRDLGISDEEGKNFRCVMTIPKERVTKKYIEPILLQQRITFNPAMLEPESSFMKDYISRNAFYINLYNLDSGVFIAVNNDNTNDKNVSGEPFLPNSDIVLLNQPTSVANKLNRGSSKFLLTRMYQYDITNSKTQKAMDSYFDNQLPKICKKDKEGYHGLEDTPNSKGIFYGIKQYKIMLGFRNISQIEPIKKKVQGEMMHILVLDFANQSIDKGTSSEKD